MEDKLHSKEVKQPASIPEIFSATLQGNTHKISCISTSVCECVCVCVYCLLTAWLPVFFQVQGDGHL